METSFSLDITRETYLKRWQQRSENSKDLAEKALIWFDRYIKTQNLNESEMITQLKQISNQPTFYQFLDNYVQYMASNKLSPRTVITYFAFTKSYLRSKGFRIYREDVKQFIRFPKIIKESKEPVTMESIAKLYSKATKKYKAIISCAVSSGARIGELLQLKMSDIKDNKLYIRSETTKTKADRITYISKQAEHDLKKWTKGKTKNAFAFGQRYTPVQSVLEVEKGFAKLRDKCSLTKKYRLTNYHHITIHRLRAFCKTMASEVCGQDFAEGLVGHEGYLSTYYALPETMRQRNYQKLEPFLTIPTMPEETKQYNENLKKLNTFKASQINRPKPQGHFNHG